MSRHLNEAQWALIAAHLPAPKKTGRKRADDRTTLEGILFILRTGCPWSDPPRECSSPTTVWRRLRQWEEAGVWEHIWRAMLSTLDAQGKLEWVQAFLDGSFVPAKKGGEPSG